MPPNLPQCGHFSSNKPDGGNGPFPYPLLKRPGASLRFKATECYSPGARPGVSTLPPFTVRWPSWLLLSIIAVCDVQYGRILPPYCFFVKLKIFGEELKIPPAFWRFCDKPAFVCLRKTIAGRFDSP